MGMGKPIYADLDESFQKFLNELQKCPVSESKKTELVKRLKEAIYLEIRNEQANTEINPSINDNLIQLDMNKFNSGSTFLKSTHIKHTAVNWASGLALFSAGLLFITIGIILIVTPATPEFEIATIFYFNDHDGFTVMDLFALVIIFMGIYLFIKAFISKDRGI